LQYVLGISGTAGDAVGGAKNAVVMRSEERFELPRRVWNGSQGSNGCLHCALLKIVARSINEPPEGLLTVGVEYITK